MANIIEMPKLSDTMVTGKILSWIKSEGDAVDAGEAIAEVETDKATMELEVFEEGTLLKILAEAESAIPVGGPIAILGEKGENIDGLIKEAKAKLKKVQEKAASEQAEEKEAEKEEEVKTESKPASKENEAVSAVQTAPTTQTQAVSEASTDGKRLKVSPVAQRMAAEHNINLQAITGTGPGGRIVKRDIEEAIEKGGATVAPTPAAQPVAATTAAPYEDISLSSNRETIARRLPQSLGPVPHFYLEMEIDAEPILSVKDHLQELAGDVRITVTDILVKACTVALRKHPEVNSQFTGKALRRFKSVNIGLAVAGKGTLMVPVIQACETKPITEIALERAALVEKAQSGRLSSNEMSGGTFTISNLGMFGITRFSAIINPPEASILAVGATRDEPVVKNGQIVPGKRMTLTLSCDHRVFDGAEGARFMATLKQILENPIALSL